MKRHHRLFVKWFLLLILAAVGAGCAKPPYMNVNYTIPESSEMTDNQPVYIDFKDLRSNPTILGDAAQEHFRNFNNRFHLYIDHNHKDQKFTGRYDVMNLIKETFNRRLTQEGFQVANIRKDGRYVLEFELKQFALDLKGNNWISLIEYTTRLVYAPNAYVSENIIATAERQKIFGRKEAEKALSDALTDAVNRLDIKRLIDKAAKKN